MNRPIAKPLFLCGMMGSGKSTIGRRLASSLDLPFYDLDMEISNSEKMSIPKIFATRGESRFREVERNMLIRVSNKTRGVIALGGGALQNQALTDHLKERGVLIFLDAPLSVLLNRLKNDKNRPLLHQDNRQTGDSVKELLDDRMPLYTQSHITIETGGKTPEEIVASILEKLENHEC